MSGIVTEMNDRNDPCRDSSFVLNQLFDNDRFRDGFRVECFLNVPEVQAMVPVMRLMLKSSAGVVSKIYVTYVSRDLIDDLVSSNKLSRVKTKKHSHDVECSTYVLSQYGREQEILANFLASATR